MLLVSVMPETGGRKKTGFIQRSKNGLKRLGLQAQLSQADMPNTSRASATPPVIAAAATMTGDMRIVRPVGLPCLPLKLRFEEEAQS